MVSAHENCLLLSLSEYIFVIFWPIISRFHYRRRLILGVVQNRDGVVAALRVMTCERAAAQGSVLRNLHKMRDANRAGGRCRDDAPMGSAPAIVFARRLENPVPDTVMCCNAGGPKNDQTMLDDVGRHIFRDNVIFIHIDASFLS